MKRAEKEQLVAELKEKLESATALYYTDFTGLNVKRMTDLRRRLRKANVEYVVIKNTLALRSAARSSSRHRPRRRSPAASPRLCFGRPCRSWRRCIIAVLLRRKLRWDPVTETFPGDDEANRMLARALRSPWRT